MKTVERADHPCDGPRPHHCSTTENAFQWRSTSAKQTVDAQQIWQCVSMRVKLYCREGLSCSKIVIPGNKDYLVKAQENAGVPRAIEPWGRQQLIGIGASPQR